MHNRLLETIQSLHGQLYLVGGSVRDSLLGLPIKDADYVVTGIEFSSLKAKLETWAQVNLVGASFGVLKVSSDGGDLWTEVGGFTQADRVDAQAGRIAVWGRRGTDTWNKIYYSADDGITWLEKTGVGKRFAFLKDISVDPVVVGRIWISGISVSVIN